MCDFEINGVLVTKLRVVDLKEELEARGLSKSGKTLLALCRENPSYKFLLHN